jgi:predicted DNA-binding transcriptional regulator YafY
LTAAEVRALFLVAGPASAATPAVRSALRKLVRALPEPFRAQAEAASSSVVVDPRGWGSSRVEHRAPHHLDAVQDAVVRGVQVRLGYVDAAGAASERTVHPLGVVAQGASWYLVGDTAAGRRTFRVDRVSVVEPTDDPVRRPDDFDLAAAWRAVADEVDRSRTPLAVRVLCTPDGLDVLRIGFGGRLDVGAATADGRVEVAIRGRDERTVAGELAGLVEWVEVVDPPGVREHLAATGAALVARYR